MSKQAVVYLLMRSRKRQYLYGYPRIRRKLLDRYYNKRASFAGNDARRIARSFSGHYIHIASGQYAYVYECGRERGLLLP